MFDYLSPSSIYDTVGWAVWAWYNRPEHIEAMRLRAMKHNFSWEKSANKYIELYEKTLSYMGFNKTSDLEKADLEKTVLEHPPVRRKPLRKGPPLR